MHRVSRQPESRAKEKEKQGSEVGRGTGQEQAGGIGKTKALQPGLPLLGWASWYVPPARLPAAIHSCYLV